MIVYLPARQNENEAREAFDCGFLNARVLLILLW